MGNSKLTYKLEKMTQNLLNEFVVKDKTFRVSTPVGPDVVKRIFGHALTPKHLNEIEKHDGVVVLFTDESEVNIHKENPNVAPYRTVDLKKDSVERRKQMKENAQGTIAALEKYLGKPIIEVWEGLDQWKNIFGNRSMYICCIFALDESGFTNIVVETK